jgi:DNA-binding CsgD family transcriptional regulator
MIAWSPLILIFNLAVGIAAIALIAWKANSVPARLMRIFPLSLLLFNLHLAGLAAARFLRLAGLPDTTAAHIRAGIFFTNLGLGFGWVFSLLVLFRALTGKKGSRRPNQIGAATLLGLLALTGIAWVQSIGGIEAAFPKKLVVFAFGQKYLLALAASLFFWLRAGREQEAGRRRVLTVLGAAYSVLFFFNALLGLAYVQLAWISYGAYFHLGNLADFGFNAIPIFWILFWGRSLTPITPPFPSAAGETEVLIVKFGITGRERDVIELICRGKTNQEIADRLFLSLKTVKDHNYSIFQKTGVKNRVQLANLFSGRISE